MSNLFLTSLSVMKRFRVIMLGIITLVLVVLLPYSVGSQESSVFSYLEISQESHFDQNLREATQLAFLPGERHRGQVGDLVYASVELDGRNLFDVAAAQTSTDEQDNRATSPLEVRIQRIENRLQTFLREHLQTQEEFDALNVPVNQLNNQAVVQVVTATTSDSISIVTVTANDTEIYGLTTPEVGNYFAERIHWGLEQAYQERQSDYVQKATGWVVFLGGSTLFLSLMLLLLLRQNWRKQHQLRESLKHDTVTINDSNNDSNSRMSFQAGFHRETLAQTKHNGRQQLKHLRIYFQALVIALLLLWLVAISISLRLFPQTRFLGLLLLNRPLAIGLTWLVIVLVRRANLFIADKLVLLLLKNGSDVSPKAQERLRKRLPTLAGTLKWLIQNLLIILGIVLTIVFLFGLSGFGLFASAGVIGLAASIIFQSALQDVISGIMLLWHDAYAVGDIIAVEDNAGQVEAMTLLMTQIRSADGELISLRNSTINNVKNHTKEWSRINLTIDVALNTDTDKALSLMGKVFQEMTQDAEWQPLILEQPDILAIENLAHSGITLNIRAKTVPMQQWSVSREYRRRLKQAFEEAGIEFGAPQQIVKLQEPSPPETSQSQGFPL